MATFPLSELGCVGLVGGAAGDGLSAGEDRLRLIGFGGGGRRNVKERKAV